MTRLFIAEKPDMGRNIAKFLPGPHVKKDGYIETGGGLVTWCVGHILEQAQPEDYDPANKEWNLESLPFIPTAWKMKIADSKRKQVSVIKDLLKKCDSVVNAGDPGREGQLIVDEVLEFLGNRKPVERILLNALDKATVTLALANMVDNKQFYPLYQAALGRQRADWLIGINLTRAYSVLGSKQGRRGVLSVGRVQTPTLAIVVRRDELIEAFKPVDFFAIQAQFADDAQSDKPFWARWLPPGASLASLEAAEVDMDQEQEGDDDEEAAAAALVTGASPAVAKPAWLDEGNRIIDRNQAERIAQELRSAGVGRVTKYENKPAKESAPLPYELTGLQSAMNSKHGVSGQSVLDACQSLYEAGYTSYPRTDSSYIKVSQHADAPEVLAAIIKALPQMATQVANADPALQGRAFNDAKVGEHHAIIPTRTAPDFELLNVVEKHVYRAVSLAYLAQFYPDCLVDKATIEIESAGHKLAARGRVVKSPGWRVLFGSDASEDSTKKEKEVTPTLPQVQVGQELTTKNVDLTQKQTKPPPRYTEGTLLQAMKHIDRHVTDPVEKKKLKAVEGIGRSATRTGIINTLLKRVFVKPEGKALISTPIARILIKVLPAQLTDPGLTARWETVLDAIASKQVTLEVFQQKQENWAKQLVQHAISTPLPPLPAAEVVAYGGAKSSTKSSGTRTASAASKSGGATKKTTAKSTSGGSTCPKCGKGQMREREARTGTHAGKKFKGCSNYPECKHSEWPK